MIGVIVHTLASRFILLCIMIVGFIPGAIFLALPSKWRYDSKLFYIMCHCFYWAVLKGTFVPIKFIGKENIPEDPAIIVANHQSSLDIPLVGSLVNCHPHVWLATHELLKSPILRFIIPRVAVLVDMTSPMKGMRSLMQAVTMVHEEKRHAIIFPEGSRYHDDAVHDFYAGFVILAKKTGRPVVPVRIFNANKVYPVGSFLVHWYPVTVLVGKPMFMHEDEEVEAFSKRVHQWFVEQTEE